MLKYVECYDIDNKVIDYAAKCVHCGNVVDTKPLRDLVIPGVVTDIPNDPCALGRNPLLICDKISSCCDNPDYSYFEAV